MEVEEVVTAFDIPSGAERRRLKSLIIHVVFPIFMSVYVLSKLKEAMFCELDRLDVNNGSWDKRCIDAVLLGEAVDPELHGINDLAHEDTWESAIYLNQFRVKIPNLLLHSPVESFNIWNVLISDGCVCSISISASSALLGLPGLSLPPVPLLTGTTLRFPVV